MQIGSCELYGQHELISNTMKGFSLRSEEYNLDEKNHNDESYSNMDFIAEDNICAIAGKNSSEPFWFFLIKSMQVAFYRWCWSYIVGSYLEKKLDIMQQKRRLLHCIS